MNLYKVQNPCNLKQADVHSVHWGINPTSKTQLPLSCQVSPYICKLSQSLPFWAVPPYIGFS